jgi:hypothetical protein
VVAGTRVTLVEPGRVLLASSCGACEGASMPMTPLGHHRSILRLHDKSLVSMAAVSNQSSDIHAVDNPLDSGQRPCRGRRVCLRGANPDQTT